MSEGPGRLSIVEWSIAVWLPDGCWVVDSGVVAGHWMKLVMRGVVDSRFAATF